MLTVGTYLNSGLSTTFAGYTVSMSNTSAYEIPSSVTIGTAFELTIQPPTNKQHVLSWIIGSNLATGSVTIAAGSEAPSMSASVTIPLSTLNSLTAATSYSVEWRLQTSGGGTLIRNGTVTVPESAKPSFSPSAKPTVAPDYTGLPAASKAVLDGWGIFVASLGVAKVTQSTAATISYSSPIKSYKITGNGCNSTGTSLPLVATSTTLTSGEKVFTTTATDNRGRTAAINSDAISVYPYSNPYVTTQAAIRCDAQGQAADEGTYIKASATPVVTSLDGRNSVTVTVSYRLSGSSTWYTAGTLNNQNTLVFHQGGSGSPEITTADNWEVRFTSTDTIGMSSNSIVLVPRATWEMHVKRGGGAWAFGGVADEDGALKVYGEIKAALGTVPTAVCNIGTDLNNATEPGFYTFESSYSNTPPVTAGGGLLVVQCSWATYQLAFLNSTQLDVHIWARTKYYNSNTWSSWSRMAYPDGSVDRGGDTMTGALSTSLGYVPAAICDIGTDLNNATAPGFYMYTSSYSNTPVAAGGTLIVSKYNNNILSQLAFSNSSSKNVNIWARHFYSDGWSTWWPLSSGLVSWTPQLYDNTTYVRNLPASSYFRTGQLVIAWMYGTFNFSGISTMLQIRNLPMNVVLGGTAYIGELNQTSFDHPFVVQGGTSYLYIRPNIKSSMLSTPSSTSNVSFMIIGYVS